MVNKMIELDETALSAADAVVISVRDPGSPLASRPAATLLRAAIRAYLMAAEMEMVAPFQVAADAIEHEVDR